MSIYRKGKIWHIYICKDGQRIRQSTSTEDKAKAQELHDKLKAQLWDEKKLGVLPKYTWEDAVVKWCNEMSHKKSINTDLEIFRYLDKHLKGMSLVDINRVKIEAIKQHKVSTGAVAGTVNRTLALLRAVLNAAYRRWDMIDKVPPVVLMKDKAKRLRWLTKEEAQLLISECPPHINGMVRFTLATGLRESNVVNLTWEQVDIARRCCWIYSDQSKSGQSIAVPLNDDAQQVLREQIGNHPDRVFVYKGKPVTRANADAWHAALNRAGIVDFRWHDLRHTWASWHVQAGTPINVLKELGGWADLKMVMRYAHLSSDHLSQFANATKISLPTTATFAPPEIKMRRIK